MYFSDDVSFYMYCVLYCNILDLTHPFYVFYLTGFYKIV